MVQRLAPCLRSEQCRRSWTPRCWFDAPRNTRRAYPQDEGSHIQTMGHKRTADVSRDRQIDGHHHLRGSEDCVHFGRQSLFCVVVPVKGNVDKTGRVFQLQVGYDAFGDPCAAGTDADDGDFRFVRECLTYLGQQFAVKRFRIQFSYGWVHRGIVAK